eukprot:2477307-Amphidinium_carterae.3
MEENQCYAIVKPPPQATFTRYGSYELHCVAHSTRMRKIGKHYDIHSLVMTQGGLAQLSADQQERVRSARCATASEAISCKEREGESCTISVTSHSEAGVRYASGQRQEAHITNAVSSQETLTGMSNTVIVPHKGVQGRYRSAIFPWMVKHVGFIRNTFQVGQDGQEHGIRSTSQPSWHCGRQSYVSPITMTIRRFLRDWNLDGHMDLD